MKKLNVRFSPQTKQELENLVDMFGFDESKIARAAMDFGIAEIMKAYGEGGKKKAVAKIGVQICREVLKK